MPYPREVTVRVKMKRSGNSTGIRIPPSVLCASRLGRDEAVDVREEAGRTVIEPIRQKVYDLSELLRGITTENQHQPVDFDVPGRS